MIGIPIFAAVLTALLADQLKFTSALFAWLFAGAISIVVFPIGIVIDIFRITYNGIIDLFRSVIFGARDGYEGGLFFHVLNRFIFDFVVFSSNLQRSVATLVGFAGSQNNALNAEAFNILYQADADVVDYFNLQDVPHSSLSEVPDLHERPQAKKVEFNPLSLDELQQAQGIANMLGEIVPAYKSLHERLTNLNEDIATRGNHSNADLENIMDEVMMVAITEPALLVKQYQDEHGNWRVIPDRTKIIDKPSLEKWLSQKNSHPETRESMDNANSETIAGVSRITRYRIRPYISMNDAQELIEASITIRKKIQEVNPANIQVGQVVAGLTTNFRETFFGHAQNSANTQEESRRLSNII